MSKIQNIFPTLIIFFLTYNTFQAIACPDEDCDFKDLHHHGSKIICLGRQPDLTGSQLDHFLKYHIKKIHNF
ncbi:MAG: hypothetical protein KBC28_04720 [Alphaproteobacteria bacterium]|jgi:hypothetical protein|nr:hypothetical protein [Alphaproteobacteria bacterium]